MGPTGTPRKKIVAIILVATGLAAGCAKEPGTTGTHALAGSGHGKLVRSDATPDPRLLPDPGFDGPGTCGFQYYTHDQATGEAAPAGQLWRYCICTERPTNDRVSFTLAGGWTYPAWNCSVAWGAH